MCVCEAFGWVGEGAREVFLIEAKANKCGKFYPRLLQRNLRNVVNGHGPTVVPAQPRLLEENRALIALDGQLFDNLVLIFT